MGVDPSTNVAASPPQLPAMAGLAGAPMMATPAEQPEEVAPVVSGPAGSNVEGPANPGMSVARHIMMALGGSDGRPMDWAKGIISGGLAAAANVGKVPEGGGWLAGAAKGTQGLVEHQRQQMLDRRQQMLDQQRLQQQQFENQEKLKADTRAEKELANATDRTKAEIALWNTKNIAAVHEEQFNQSIRPYLQGEAKDKFEAVETAKQQARADFKKVLIESGVKPEELEKAYSNYDDVPSGAAQNIGASNLMVAHNGEKPSADEDNVGLHAIANPAKIWDTPIESDKKVLSGYQFNPKTNSFTPQYTTASKGTTYGTLFAMHAAAMDYLQQQENQVSKQAQLKHEQAQTFQAQAAGRKDIAEAKQMEAFGGGAGGGAPQNIDPKTGADEGFLSSLSPAIAAEVRSIGEGRVEVNSRMFQSKQGQQLAAALSRAYPGFDQSRAQAYFKMRQDFTSGKTSTGINSYNTGIAHLGTMYDHLASSNSFEINNPWSTTHRQLDLDKQLVSTELAKAVSNGQMTEGEKKDILNSISGHTVNSYLDRIREAVTLLHGKQEAYQEQWNNGAPPGAVSQVHIISPKAEQTISKISGHAQAAAVGQPPAGATHKVPGPDGKIHWTNAQGTVDYGVAQ